MSLNLNKQIKKIFYTVGSWPYAQAVDRIQVIKDIGA